MQITRLVLPFAIFILFFQNSYCQEYSIEEESIDSIISWMVANETLDSTYFHDVGLRVLARAKATGDTRDIAQIHEAIAAWIAYSGLLPRDSVVYHDREAVDYYLELNDSVKLAKMYQVLSIDEMNAGAFEDARKHVFEAMAFFQALDDEEGVANAHRTMSNLHTLTQEPEASIKYALIALEYYERVNDYYKMSVTYLPLMLSYLRLDSLEQAHWAADQCISIVEDHLPDGQFILARALTNKSDVYVQQGKLDEALAMAQKSFNIVKAEVGALRASSFGEPIADVLMLKKQYNEALSYFLPILESTDNQNLDHLFPLYEKIATCYEKIGDFENALIMERRKSDMQQKMSEDKIANLESEAFIKYETEIKDQAIAAQEKELRQNSRIQMLGMVIFLILAALVFTLFRLFLKNKKIAQSLKIKNNENEFLLKEIHHRVKNNLQILSSLLSLQSSYIQDEKASDAIMEGRNRVESMGLIHQKLYNDAHKMGIDLKEYMVDLCSYLSDSFLLEEQNISITSTIDVQLVDVETAIPLGLIVNELITNSIKYAFPDKKEGIIHVAIWVNKLGQLSLRVADNGKGLQSDKETSARSSNFGTDLVKVLIKKLKGTIIQEPHQGYSTLISFDRYQLLSDS